MFFLGKSKKYVSPYIGLIDVRNSASEKSVGSNLKTLSPVPKNLLTWDLLRNL